jgi:hypothetical protein
MLQTKSSQQASRSHNQSLPFDDYMLRKYLSNGANMLYPLILSTIYAKDVDGRYPSNVTILRREQIESL